MGRQRCLLQYVLQQKSPANLLTNFQDVGSLEVNAFQRQSTVVLQKSIREGFGLVVSEAMWKKRPVIGGNVGGITTQIEDPAGALIRRSLFASAFSTNGDGPVRMNRAIQ